MSEVWPLVVHWFTSTAEFNSSVTAAWSFEWVASRSCLSSSSIAELHQAPVTDLVIGEGTVAAVRGGNRDCHSSAVMSAEEWVERGRRAGPRHRQLFPGYSESSDEEEHTAEECFLMALQIDSQHSEAWHYLARHLSRSPESLDGNVRGAVFNGVLYSEQQCYAKATEAKPIRSTLVKEDEEHEQHWRCAYASSMADVLKPPSAGRS